MLVKTKRGQQDYYLKKLKKSIRILAENLEANDILAKSWLEEVKARNQGKSIIFQIDKLDNFKDKITCLVKSKLDSIIPMLKQTLKVTSQERLSQSTIKAFFPQIRKELAASLLPFLSIMILTLMTQILMESRDYFEGTLLAKVLFTISDIFFEHIEMLKSIETQGKCLKNRRLYFEAIETFRIQLFLSWSLNDMFSEMRAYDNLGLGYFYTNELEKAHKYHLKSVRAVSELEDSDLNKNMLTRLAHDKKKRLAYLGSKNLFFRYSLSADLVEDPNRLNDVSLKSELSRLQCNFTQFDESAVRPLKPEISKKIRISKKLDDFGLKLKHLKEKQFTASFSKEGLMHSLALSNPKKHEMIETGLIEVEPNMLENIDLRDEFGSATSVCTLLTHQSQNKSAESFVNYHSFHPDQKGPLDGQLPTERQIPESSEIPQREVEICLEYISTDIRGKLKKNIGDWIYLLEIISLNIYD